MTPTTILAVLLTIVCVRPFIDSPDARERGAAQARGGYTARTKVGCLYMLLLPVTVGLWWWYALLTDQLLLGVIPTAGIVAITVTLLAEAAGRKAEAAKTAGVTKGPA